LKRIVLPELLDFLPPEDASALRSRRDLRRLNALMRNPRIMARALAEHSPGVAARQVIELGAGDGHFLRSVAGCLNADWRGTEALLLDRLGTVDPGACAALVRSGWRARAEVAEAGEFLRGMPSRASRVVVSNLFFHQFADGPLAELLGLAARSCSLVVAVEPRRAWWPRICGGLLWFAGCGPVTRHDAAVSIRAGFTGRELSALWPDHQAWQLTERPVGMFSHLFVARRTG